MQSLDNDLLNLLGRRHQASEAISAFQTARQAGFDNVNLDLMYGLPNQSMDQWRQTLDLLIGLVPEHISLYALTLEEGTPMHRWAAEGKKGGNSGPSEGQVGLLWRRYPFLY